MDKYQIQYDNYKKDKDKYGDIQQGKYRGYKWLINRNEGLGTWCGYITTDISEMTPRIVGFDMGEIEYLSHGGITSINFGFDTAHRGDFIPFYYHSSELGIPNLYDLPSYTKNQNIIYKDFSYVFRVIKRMIDYLSKYFPQMDDFKAELVPQSFKLRRQWHINYIKPIIRKYVNSEYISQLVIDDLMELLPIL